MRRNVNVLIFLDVRKALEGTNMSTLPNKNHPLFLYCVVSHILPCTFRGNEALHIRQQGDFNRGF